MPGTARARHGKPAVSVLLGLALAFAATGCAGDQTEDNSPASGVMLSGSPRVEADRPSPSAPMASTTGLPGGADPVASVVLDPEAEVEVADQTGDGRQVRLEEVEMTSRGFVVVVSRPRQVVLGVAPVDSEKEGFAVGLERPVEGNQRLVVMLFADDGDGDFDPTEDGRIVDDEGEAVIDDLLYRLQ
jgi:hypothetical protein